jgi:uncharacterized membrane protein
MNTPDQMQTQHPTLTTVAELKARKKPLTDVNAEHEKSLTRLERLAVWITDKVGTMGFFLVIFVWTVLWCGYNIIATEVPALHWKAFDPFPAFVAYLLMSNVIQILLMPLIMVGQNLQGMHSERRAEHDLEVNIKAEEEIELILLHLEQQQRLLLKLIKAQGIEIDKIEQLQRDSMKD